jgi:VCBS repeat protein
MAMKGILMPHGGKARLGSHCGLALVLFLALSSWSRVANSQVAFTSHRVFADGNASSTIEFVAAADLDEDGRADVLAIYDGSLLAYIGGGTGDFLTTDGLGEDGHTARALVVDFNSDGHPDIVALRNVGSSPETMVGWLSLRLGLGGGTFTAPIELELRAGTFSGLTSGDFDGDGQVDFAVTSRSLGYVLLVHGDGVNQVSLGRHFWVTGSPAAIAAGDLNGDGRPDVVVTSQTASEVSVLLADGPGSFGLPHAVPAFTSSAVVLSRATSDNFLDIVLPSGILEGHGDGTFEPPVAFTGLSNPSTVAVADVNEDGRPDFLVGYGDTNGTVSVILGDGTPRPTISIPYPVTDRYIVAGIVPTDLDGDGHLDLAIGGSRCCFTVLKYATMLNVTFADLPCMHGGVNAFNGPPVDVLFVNDSPGSGSERIVRIATTDPFEIRLEAPPSRSGASTPFVLYAWLDRARAGVEYSLPYGIGRSCLRMPITSGAPLVTWNNLGHVVILGRASAPSTPAPSTVLRRPNGVSRRGVFFLQGLILDQDSLSGLLAVTNGVVVSVE